MNKSTKAATYRHLADWLTCMFVQIRNVDVIGKHKELPKVLDVAVARVVIVGKVSFFQVSLLQAERVYLLYRVLLHVQLCVVCPYYFISFRKV